MKSVTPMARVVLAKGVARVIGGALGISPTGSRPHAFKSGGVTLTVKTLVLAAKLEPIAPVIVRLVVSGVNSSVLVALIVKSASYRRLDGFIALGRGGNAAKSH